MQSSLRGCNHCAVDLTKLWLCWQGVQYRGISQLAEARVYCVVCSVVVYRLVSPPPLLPPPLFTHPKTISSTLLSIGYLTGTQSLVGGGGKGGGVREVWQKINQSWLQKNYKTIISKHDRRGSAVNLSIMMLLLTYMGINDISGRVRRSLKLGVSDETLCS